MSARKVKAWKMWQSISGTIWRRKCPHMKFGITKAERVYVLPADANSIERMVEQMAQSAYALYGRGSLTTGTLADAYRNEARAALAAIGIPSRVPNRICSVQRPSSATP